MKRLLIPVLLLLILSCNKQELVPVREKAFITYVIPAGAHFSTQSAYRAFSDSVLKFTVRFDSSAIYSSRLAENQRDINKLYGFSEEGGHHENSARFGWNWENGRLNLYAYSYVEGERNAVAIGQAQIGAEYACTITVTGDAYIFQFNNITRSLARAVKTAKATGYLLYPYFGGDETAPHEIRIYIRP